MLAGIFFFLIFKQRKQQNTHFVCSAEIEPAPALPRLQTKLSPLSPLITAKQMLEKLIIWQRKLLGGGNSEALGTHISITLLLR